MSDWPIIVWCLSGIAIQIAAYWKAGFYSGGSRDGVVVSVILCPVSALLGLLNIPMYALLFAFDHPDD